MTELKVEIVFAVDGDGVCGLKTKNSMAWGLEKRDMENFKALTLGEAIFMGKQTWYSLPKEFRPLPGRLLNLVMTSGKDENENGRLVNDGATVVADFETLRSIVLGQGKDTVFLIGGPALIRSARSYANENPNVMQITKIHRTLFLSGMASDERGCAFSQEKRGEFVFMTEMIDPASSFGGTEDEARRIEFICKNGVNATIQTFNLPDPLTGVIVSSGTLHVPV